VKVGKIKRKIWRKTLENSVLMMYEHENLTKIKEKASVDMKQKMTTYYPSS